MVGCEMGLFILVFLNHFEPTSQIRSIALSGNCRL